MSKICLFMYLLQYLNSAYLFQAMYLILVQTLFVIYNIIIMQIVSSSLQCVTKDTASTTSAI